MLVFFLRIPFVFNAAFMDKKKLLTQMTKKMPFPIDCQNEEKYLKMVSKFKT